MYVPDKIQEIEILMRITMKQLKFIQHSFIILTLFSISLFISCNKDEDKLPDTGAIKILSLTATDTVLKAWYDTTDIKVVATGDSLKYKWECNHGTLHGSGITVKYMAGECCVGLNTITCTVFNDSSSVSKDINIRITSYFEH
jgi:hypothetical protein